MYNQKQAIINYIKTNGSITSIEAYTQLGITQLATRISELKEIGYTFSCEWIYAKNRNYKQVRFKKYFLKEAKDETRNSVKTSVTQ